MRAVVFAVIGAGCGFQHGAAVTGGGSADAPAQGDGPAIGDAMADAAPARAHMFANSGSSLFSINTDGQAVTPVGTIHSTGQASISIDALAYSDGVLYGIPFGGDQLLAIDTTTATVTSSTPLNVTHAYWAMTAAPAGDAGPNAVLFAASNDTTNNIFTIALDGTVTKLGSLGGNHAIAGDLAWVHGAGLFASIVGTPCNMQCLAKLDPTTGAITQILNMQEPNDLWGLSGFRDQLWVLEGTGEISTANTTNGSLTPVFNAGSINWYDGD